MLKSPQIYNSVSLPQSVSDALTNKLLLLLHVLNVSENISINMSILEPGVL